MKEKFKLIESWVLENEDLVKLIRNDHKNYSLFESRNAIFWYEDVLKNKELFFGEKKVTLKDIEKEVYFSLSNDNDFTKMIIGDWDDDFHWKQAEDSLETMLPELFNYLYYTLEWNKEKYMDELFNSMTFTDELQDMFPPDFTPPNNKKSEEQLDEMVEEEKMAFANFLVKYDTKQDHPNLEYVNVSRIDGKPIYKVKIPYGCEVIHSIKF